MRAQSQLKRRGTVAGLTLLAAILVTVLPATAAARHHHSAHASAWAHAHSRRSGGVTVGVKSAGRLGRILDDAANGRTLYVFMRDRRDRSACYGGCEGIWPPLRSSGRPTARGGVLARRLATIKHGHGDRQVTYDGRPLYLYAGDRSAKQVKGEGLKSFGGRWYAVSPSGRPVKR